MTESGWKTFLGSNATSPHNPQPPPLGSFNHFHNTVNRLLVILSLIVVVAVAFAFIVIFSSVVHSPIVSFILFYYREMFIFYFRSLLRLPSLTSSSSAFYSFIDVIIFCSLPIWLWARNRLGLLSCPFRIAISTVLHYLKFQLICSERT